jgi:hypothetical protein
MTAKEEANKTIESNTQSISNTTVPHANILPKEY